MSQPAPHGTLRVFLSSTSVDLEPYRDRVASLVQHGFGQFAVTMGDFPLQPHKDATRVSLEGVVSCQVYIMLLAWRYGHVPEGQEGQPLSVTHQEYREARRLGQPCFVFLADERTIDDVALFPSEERDPAHAEQLLAFRAEVQRQQLVGYFTTRDDLVDKVTAALYDYLQRIGRPGRIPRDLPPRAPGFVGRQQELDQLLTTMRSGQSVGLSALVAGLGGVGKSALAAEALSQVAADEMAFPGGITWVRCDARTGLEGLTWVYDQVLNAWGARLSPEALRGVGADAEAQVEAREHALRERLGKLPGPALALLDNVEVAFPLRQALDHLKPLGITLLVTARHRLSLPGLRLQTLEVLDPNAALALFVERYTSQEGTWEAARDAPAAQRVVDALGRLALAIELAAARAALTHLGVAGLAAEVQQPDALARLQDPLREEASVRYSFKRSLALLRPAQRVRFAALGLPQGPDWPRPVIEALFATVSTQDDPGVSSEVAADVVNTAGEDLDRLVALSLVSLAAPSGRPADPSMSSDPAGLQTVKPTDGLVTVDPGQVSQGGARVRLHPLLRLLATEAWAQELAATQQAGRRGLLWGVKDWVDAHHTHDAQTYAQLEADEALILGALRDAVEIEAAFTSGVMDLDSRVALRAVIHTTSQLYGYLNEGGHWQLGVTVLNLALQAALATDDRWSEGAFVSNLAMLKRYLGENAESQRLHKQGLAVSREVGDRVGESANLGALGDLALWRGDYASARALYEEALALDHHLGDRTGDNLNSLGILAYQQGNYAEAHHVYEQALTIERGMLNWVSEARVLANLAELALAERDLLQAHACLDVALPLARKSGARDLLCFILFQHGELARLERRWDAATHWLDEAEALNQYLSSRDIEADILSARARLQRDQGQVEAARLLFAQALAHFEALGEAFETKKVHAELAALDEATHLGAHPATDPKPDKQRRRRWWPW